MSNKSASKVTRTRDRSEATTLAPVSVFMHLTDRQGKPARGKKFSCHEPVFNQHTRKGEPNRRQSRKKALFKPYKRTIGRKWVHYKGMARNGLKSFLATLTQDVLFSRLQGYPTAQANLYAPNKQKEKSHPDRWRYGKSFYLCIKITAFWG